MADQNCSLVVDGDASSKRAVLRNEPQKIPIEVGEHILACTASGVSVTQEIQIDANTPAQKILHINLTDKLEKIARQDQNKSEEDKRVSQQSTEEREQQDAVLLNISKLKGSFVCATEPALQLVQGRTATNTSSIVLTAEMLTLHLSIDDIDAGNNTVSGRSVITRSRRMANQYEIAKDPNYQIMQMQFPIVCFDSQHEQCVTSATTTTSFHITKVVAAKENQIILKMENGVCSGTCPDDGYIAPIDMPFRFQRDHPGFRWLRNSFCQKQ